MVELLYAQSAARWASSLFDSVLPSFTRVAQQSPTLDAAAERPSKFGRRAKLGREPCDSSTVQFSAHTHMYTLCHRKKIPEYLYETKTC